jgi:hypothetical protein
MEKLYKKNLKGEIIEWSAKVVHNDNSIDIYKYHGMLQGTITTEIQSNIKGKNIGKTNETSPAEQAKLEVESYYRKKKRQGYKSLEDLNYNEGNGLEPVEILSSFLKRELRYDNTDADGDKKPMLFQQYYRKKCDKGKNTWLAPDGKEYDDRKYYYLQNPYVEKEPNSIIIKFPCIIQPKLNGVRATIYLNENNKVVIKSKEGVIYNIPHIEKEFEDNIECFTYSCSSGEYDIIFDGEIYIHGESLQTISSAVKAPNFDTPRLKFVVYDLAIPNISNLDRIKLFKHLLEFRTQNLNTPIDIVKSHIINDDETVQKMTDDYIKEGYEGSIMRDLKAHYAFGKRPMTGVKLKRCIDEEFKIIDIKRQDKNPNLGLFVCKTKKGEIFDVNPKGDEAFKEMILLLKSDYIGKKLTCVFYEYTDSGKPFHIIDNIVRDYE